MALVVSSAPLAALWAKAEAEKRPAERAPRQHSTGSSSSRRTSSGSSGAETLDSSASASFSSTQQSGSSSASKPSPKKHKARARHRGADVVLHVGGCAFALHSRVLKRKCGVLYRFIAQLRTKNAVGLLASGDASDGDDHNGDELEPLPLHGLTSSHLHYGGHLDDDDQDDCAGLFRSRDKQFVLRQCAPLRSSRQATPTNRQHARCVLLPRSQLLERATQSSPARPPKFSKVCCVAHKRTEDSSPSSSEEPRQRSAEQRQAEREEFSPGKENYASAGLSTSTVRSRPVPRVALAPKMPFSSATSSYVPSLRSNTASASMNPNVPSTTVASAGSSPSSSSPRRESPSVAPDAFAVELIGASADAVATFIEYLYTGKTAGIHQGNAATITSLCKWFWMEDHLLYAALVARARNVQSAEQWMDVLLSCRTIRSKPKRNILVNYLLGRLSKLTADQYRNVMEDMPLHRLPAIDDADLLAHIMTNMVNNLRHVKIWHKLTFALELWLFWSFGRRFAAAVPLDHPHPITVRQPMSLLDFHHKFVSWNPVIRIREVNISGIDAYIKPTTLFSFGPFVFQVRLEPNRSPLMNWRVVRAGTPSDLDDESEQCQFLPGMEPTFTLRGQLCIMHRDSPTGPPRQNNIFVRYSHTEVTYGKWHVLLSTSSAHKSQVGAHTNEPESEEKTQEPDSSQEETAPLEPDSDSELDPRSLAYRRADSPSTEVLPRTPPPPPSFNSSGGEISGSSGNSPFEPIASQLSGQVFVWGHRLCNLYHFLMVSTLFYQLPRDAPHELRFEAVQARLRELPVETLILVLQSDRLRVPEGETALAAAVAALCLSDFGALHYSIEQIRALFRCVRWCFVDLEQIMVTLEHARRELQLYELVEQQLRDHYNFGTTPRRTPWGDDDEATPYRATTTLVEFQIEAGDRSLSPSKFLLSQE